MNLAEAVVDFFLELWSEFLQPCSSGFLFQQEQSFPRFFFVCMLLTFWMMTRANVFIIVKINRDECFQCVFCEAMMASSCLHVCEIVGIQLTPAIFCCCSARRNHFKDSW